jgi:hypothetical protein
MRENKLICNEFRVIISLLLLLHFSECFYYRLIVNHNVRLCFINGYQVNISLSAYFYYCFVTFVTII